jgi:hypothetical protein
MSDTPIFDQLAAERGYSRMLSGGSPVFTGVRLTRPARPLSYSETVDAIQLVMAPGAYIDSWNGGQTDETVNAAPIDDEEVIFVKPIPVTTLAELAKGTHQE